MFSKQAWKVLTVRRVTGARGSDRRYENRFRNRHATKHERDHTDVHGYFWKIRHASSILYSLDIVSKWVIAHFQKRFWYWLEGGNCWKCWFNRRLFKRNLLIWTAERRDGNLKALRGVNEKNPCKRVNSWLSIGKLKGTRDHIVLSEYWILRFLTYSEGQSRSAWIPWNLKIDYCSWSWTDKILSSFVTRQYDLLLRVFRVDVPPTRIFLSWSVTSVVTFYRFRR